MSCYVGVVDVTLSDALVKLAGAGCRCANCQNITSSRSQSSEPDNSEVEQEELQGDRSL